MKLYLSLLFAVVAVAFPLIESEVKRMSSFDCRIDSRYLIHAHLPLQVAAEILSIFPKLLCLGTTVMSPASLATYVTALISDRDM